MPYKNTAIHKQIYAWDAVNGVGKTGDSGNITVRGVGDGSEYTPAAPAVTEVDSTNLPGVYDVTLSASENNYSNNMIGGKSTSAGIVIQPVHWTNETSALTLAKNVAFSNFPFIMFDAAGNPKTGLTITATRSLDGGAFGACANSASEIANGAYKINLAATDTNANTIILRFAATGAAVTMIPILTRS